ncbi:hypothetical protein C3B44_11105 [Corynebacterium yudongzhengii]|uniref:Uncharacterized protein n=2 Tax=Corynebacterium yudongzhengii TaxID=2080740 RepID=A0A2U1T807_9CORY|nr:DUF6474 family protein [Corynebacterium yudongzhengii]AWB82811.1 hypothetical protein C3B44_11105 [Corynebacterium yudongzhengii]PWC02129.1 hypothetical protein DF222_03290 [Corynebacterium yudongzhengii]
MGVLKKLRKRRSQAKAEIKAAQTKARQEVQASAKALNRREKLLAKQEKALLKAEKKGLKNKRKHELALAKAEYQKRKHGRFNADNVNRYLKAGRIALPVLLPLIYRGITQLRDTTTNARAKRAGVTRAQLAQFSGHGAGLHARIQGIRNSLEGTHLPAGFRRDMDDRLNELRSATDNAEFMTADQRRRAHNAINSDIDKVTAEIQAKITG